MNDNASSNKNENEIKFQSKLVLMVDNASFSKKLRQRKY